MSFVSTRGFYNPEFTFQDVISLGLAPDGGLFMPKKFPNITIQEIENILPLSYEERVADILSRFDTGLEKEKILELAKKAYSSFTHEKKAPAVILNEKNAILELFHGPTASFKDMALQMTPELFSAVQTDKNKKYCVLTATSGDTGIAAIEGFKKIPNVSVIVLYPKGGVSTLQEMQMRSIEDKNVLVIAVESDFDFCQTTVKNIFADETLCNTLQNNNIYFTAANSMNWGRLLPQVVYYFSAYADLINQKAIVLGEEIEVCVPSGNFGNLLASFIAKKMGLPISKFICASNENNVLSEFFQTGEYKIQNKHMIATDSPSIDILISSNIERFLFLMNGGNAEEIKQWFLELKQNGTFAISAELLEEIQSLFASGYTVHEEMQNTIREILEEYQYLLDPHTAVAVNVSQHIPQKNFRITAATAHYQKFAPAMAKVFGISPESSLSDIFTALKNINSSVPSHPSLEKLLQKTPKQNTTVAGTYESIVQNITQFLE